MSDARHPGGGHELTIDVWRSYGEGVSAGELYDILRRWDAFRSEMLTWGKRFDVIAKPWRDDVALGRRARARARAWGMGLAGDLVAEPRLVAVSAVAAVAALAVAIAGLALPHVLVDARRAVLLGRRRGSVLGRVAARGGDSREPAHGDRGRGGRDRGPRRD